MHRRHRRPEQSVNYGPKLSENNAVSAIRSPDTNAL